MDDKNLMKNALGFNGFHGGLSTILRFSNEASFEDCGKLFYSRVLKSEVIRLQLKVFSCKAYFTETFKTLQYRVMD